MDKHKETSNEALGRMLHHLDEDLKHEGGLTSIRKAAISRRTLRIIDATKTRLSSVSPSTEAHEVDEADALRRAYRAGKTTASALAGCSTGDTLSIDQGTRADVRWCVGVLRQEVDIKYSKHYSPQELTKIFGMSWDKLKSLLDTEKIKNIKYTTKDYQIALSDMPDVAS